MLFIRLHGEEPLALLRSTAAALRPGGRLAAIHWRSDVPTPRGPDLPIQPRPEALRALLIQAGFTIEVEPVVFLPYHYGLADGWTYTTTVSWAAICLPRGCSMEIPSMIRHFVHPQPLADVRNSPC